MKRRSDGFFDQTGDESIIPGPYEVVASDRRCTAAAADTDATESDFCGLFGVATTRQLSAAHGSLGQSNGKAAVTDMRALAWMKVGDISARAVGPATSLRARGFLTIDSPPRSAHQERRPRCLAS
jgi:hypothetical protein